MAKLVNPVLFSTYFGIDSAILDASGLIDPFVNVDTQLFIDPVLLEKSSDDIINNHALAAFKEHFNNYVRLLAISEREGDAAWVGAERLLDLSEPPENGLGYGGSGTSGSSRPATVRDAIMRTSKEVIQLGAKDPEMVSLMGFFEDDVGPDTISDFTTRVIHNQLAVITEQFCNDNGIPVHNVENVPGVNLPKVIKGADGKETFIVLVPKDIVRELPVANDWSGIEEAVFQSNIIKHRVNAFLGGIAEPTIADKKAALRSTALDSAENFDEFLAAVKENVTYYDPNLDALGYYRLKSIFAKGFPGLEGGEQYMFKKGPEEIKRLVLDTIGVFQHHVEKGNLWEELWVGDKPKKERAAQLIYYAIADAFCKVHDVDINPEAHMGGGPIDFKFSDGYRARVLVEMKKSGGTVKHGYERQLEIYKDASQTQYGIYVVLDYGDLGEKLRQIQAIRTARIEAGASASDIVVIDATKKASASKRK